jgi:hypothetical protein
MCDPITTAAPADGLLDAAGLLAALFPDKKARPSVKWLTRLRDARKIPFIKIGAKTFYDAELVRAAMQAKFGFTPRETFKL